MADPSDTPLEPDFYAAAEHWLTKATEISDDPDHAHRYLLAGVGYALLAAVQMDRQHSVAFTRSITERDTRPARECERCPGCSDGPNQFLAASRYQNDRGLPGDHDYRL